MSVALALDLGTTSTAAVAIDERGRLVDIVRRSHDAGVNGLAENLAEQSPQRHRACAVGVLQELAGRLTAEPVCLGLTGQMHSVLMLDKDRQPLGNLITWQDRRANIADPGEPTYLQKYLSRCDTSALADTGCRLSPGYAAVSLFVLKEREELPTETDRMATLADWIAAELTDGEIVTERSNAASTGVYDLRNDAWSSELIAAGGLDARWFPPVVECGSAVGTLRAWAATATGLPPGLPVMVPIGDNQASVIGSVPQGEPAIQITIGTGGQINWPVENFVRVEGLDTRPLPPNRLMLVGAGMAGGDAFAWVNRTVRTWLSAFGIERDQADVYDTLTQLAGKIAPGSEGLTCEPFFRGTRQEPLRRGVFSGVGNENMTPGHVALAVLEGIAASLHRCWVNATERPGDMARIIGCGNGLEQNPLLAELLSTTFGLPVFTPLHTEAAAYGAALLAGVSVGLWSDITSAGELIQLGPRTGGQR